MTVNESSVNDHKDPDDKFVEMVTLKEEKQIVYEAINRPLVAGDKW